MSFTLQVVVASEREARIGYAIGQWFEQIARDHGGIAVELVDMADIKLPIHAEMAHPRTGQYAMQSTLHWSQTIARGDAFVFVMPEYNHSYHPGLKNGLDHLSQEWRGKPVGFVSYGGVSGGVRAQEALMPVLACLGLYPAHESVILPFAAKYLNEGVFTPDIVQNEAAHLMLNQITKLQRLLLPIREEGY